MKSIGLKWSLTIVAIISFVILMILAANTLFLGPYYARKNRSLFYQEYEDLKQAFEQPDQEILELLQDKDRRTGFLFYIVERSGPQPLRVVMTSLPNPGFAEFGPPVKKPNPRIELSREHIDFVMSQYDWLQDEALFGQIQRGSSEMLSYDLVFAAQLDSRYLLLIVRPVEQLDEHVAVANDFLMIIGLLTLVVSIVIARGSARSVVKPVKEITEIGEHIANLDFSHRYTGRARDEIGHLGNSINRISTQLDTAIRNLEESNRKLQVEMDLQRRFFAGVSHEFKTPVGLIRGYSESLKLGLAKTPEEISEFSNIILDETDRLNHLVTDIMFLVKSESAEFTLTVKSLGIINLLEDSIEKNRPLFLERGVGLTMELPPEVLLMGDENRIRQIFENLLGNALRHTEPGRSVLIKAASGKKCITVSVENEGGNIPEEHIPHLFEPLYSAHEARDKSSSGTGLGLSIVKNLVEKHEGECGIENIRTENFQGVRAWFRLPLP